MVTLNHLTRGKSAARSHLPESGHIMGFNILYYLPPQTTLIITHPSGGTCHAHALSLSHSHIQKGEELCIKVLVVFGADVNATNDYQMTPLDMAFKNQEV